MCSEFSGERTPAVSIRRATEKDMDTIRAMVRGERLDPTQLKVDQFVVAEALGSERVVIIGCAQIRRFPGARELGSLVVNPDWRRRGIGSALIQYLVEGNSGSIFLECRASLAPYYTRFGFRLVARRSLPWALKVKFGFGVLFSLLPGVSVAVMKRE